MSEIEFCEKCGYIKQQCQCDNEKFWADFETCEKCMHSYCEKNEYPCSCCVHGVTLEEHFRPKSNGDVIRNMTDSELADFLVTVNCAYAKDCMVGIADCKHENTDKDCEDCFLEWLRAEVKEGAE